MALSPERMLRECVVEPPIEPDGDPETLADETLDLRPDNFQFKESSIATYAKSIPEKRAFPLPFATSYTAGKVAQALLDAIWMAGHFRLGPLRFRLSDGDVYGHFCLRLHVQPASGDSQKP